MISSSSDVNFRFGVAGCASPDTPRFPITFLIGFPSIAGRRFSSARGPFQSSGARHRAVVEREVGTLLPGSDAICSGGEIAIVLLFIDLVLPSHRPDIHRISRRT
jgi:hypothetical protein